MSLLRKASLTAVFAASFSLFILPSYVVAQEQEGDAPTEAVSEEERIGGKALEQLQDKLSGKLMNLKRAEAQHFMVIFSNYTFISSTEKARRDVKNAVTGCKENNPDIAKKIEERFDAWDSDIEASLKLSYENLNGLIAAQDYMPSSEFQAIFALIDDTEKAKEDKFEKIPVTTPEACEFMLSKMDDTKETLKRLLIITQANFADTMQKLQK